MNKFKKYIIMDLTREVLTNKNNIKNNNFIYKEIVMLIFLIVIFICYFFISFMESTIKGMYLWDIYFSSLLTIIYFYIFGQSNLPLKENIPSYNKSYYEMEFKKSRNRIIVTSCIVILLFGLISYLHQLNKKGIDIQLIIVGITFFTVIYFIAYMLIKEYWFRLVLFKYKKNMMNDYYKKIDSYTNSIQEVECELVFVPTTVNGKLIGVLESLLYSFALLTWNMVLLGIILAVRSYVSVNSHPNKEESEFYIIGLLGSLIYSIVFTVLYVSIIKLVFGINITNEISCFLLQ